MIPRQASVSGCMDLMVRPLDTHSSFELAPSLPHGHSHTCEPIALSICWMSTQCQPAGPSATGA